jgi:hypothetical protein
MAIYNQYRWLFRRQTQPKDERCKGLKDNDTWQKNRLRPGSANLHEIEFWVDNDRITRRRRRGLANQELKQKDKRLEHVEVITLFFMQPGKIEMA